jgi:hypothetical protein
LHWQMIIGCFPASKRTRGFGAFSQYIDHTIMKMKFNIIW